MELIRKQQTYISSLVPNSGSIDTLLNPTRHMEMAALSTWTWRVVASGLRFRERKELLCMVVPAAIMRGEPDRELIYQCAQSKWEKLAISGNQTYPSLHALVKGDVPFVDKTTLFLAFRL